MSHKSKLPVLAGQRFGRWTVVSNAVRCRCACVCDCGTERAVDVHSLVRGDTKSCGCWRMVALVTHGHTRGGRKSREHAIWSAMIARCSNPDHANWKNYGYRGIAVC